jgi:subtilisin family serine protease
MRTLSLFFLALSTLLADAVPGMFVVRMDDASKDRRAALVQKQSVRQAVEQSGGHVLDSLDVVMNALVVENSSEAALTALPGVNRIYPVWERYLTMDRAPALLGATNAWERIGRDRAGLGVRIGIMDTGIDWQHPAFQDDALPAVDGFPRGNRDTDLEGTNRKIIVARSYDDLLGTFANPTPRDTIGHGTAVAMTAAGAVHQSPRGEVSGIAPKAYLGSYKVFAGSQGTTNDRIILRALEDAIADGMDIINMSFGSAPEVRADLDPLLDAVDIAASRGVLITKSAGNEGPDPGTLSTTSQTDSIVRVGATRNDRILVAAVSVGDIPYAGIPPSTTLPEEPLTAPFADVTQADSTGLACAGLPPGAFTGRVVLILRGECNFQEKLNNAQSAGARAAIIYSDDRPAGAWDPQAARLPALLVSNASGRAIQQQIAANPDITGTIQFRPAPFPVDPYQISSFSSRGPTAANTIGLDLVAVGESVYTATQRSNPNGEIYGADGYTTINGTSFSAPIAAGAAAVVKSARQGLSVRQYKSLLVNTTSVLWLNDRVANVHQGGSGLLNVHAALLAPAAAFPTALSFGAGGGTVDVSRDITVSNVTREAVSYQVGVVPVTGAIPEPAVDTFTLAPGAARTFAVRFTHTGIQGDHQGFLVIRGAGSEVDLRVPYWYAVRGSEAASITVLVPTGAEPRSGRLFRFYVRVNDDNGVAMTGQPPAVSMVAGEGSVGNIAVDAARPGTWRVDLTMGPFPGANSFRIESGSRASRLVTFSAN